METQLCRCIEPSQVMPDRDQFLAPPDWGLDLSKIQDKIHSQKSVVREARKNFNEAVTNNGEANESVVIIHAANTVLHDYRQQRNRLRNDAGLNRFGQPLANIGQQFLVPLPNKV